jgi:hypothetical protein
MDAATLLTATGSNVAKAFMLVAMHDLGISLLKYIAGSCSDKIHLIIVSNSPAFLCWTEAYMFRRSCLISAQANHRMRHTVTQINQLMHAPLICTAPNTALYISVKLLTSKYIYRQSSTTTDTQVLIIPSPFNPFSNKGLDNAFAKQSLTFSTDLQYTKDSSPLAT